VTALSSSAVGRRYFGTDGVRGIVGDVLTADLVERLGRAATLWSGRGRVFVGRDTRASGPELEDAFAAGVVSAGGSAILAGVLPTPAVALLALDLGVVISASHNPPEFNGVKFFDRDGQKLTDEAEEEIEGLLDAPATGGGELDGHNINLGCGATDLRTLQQTVARSGLDLGVAFDGEGDRMLAVDGDGNAVDGDQIVAILALHLGVDTVAVTTMTNLGFHRLMAEHDIRVVTTDVGDRYVLEALRREGAILGGEQSGHIIYLRDHVTGDGLASALLLCRALEGRSLAEAAAVMPTYPQVKENFPARGRKPSEELLREVDRLNAELGDRGRVLVRRSGTESLIRMLAEAETQAEAEELSARIGALVRRELGRRRPDAGA